MGSTAFAWLTGEHPIEDLLRVTVPPIQRRLKIANGLTHGLHQAGVRVSGPLGQHVGVSSREACLR